MTSNLPSMDAVKKHFRPEFINRIDEIVFFNQLGKDVMSGIVEIQLRGVRNRLAARRIDLNVTDAAIKWLGDHGFDPVFGARPLKRLITSAVEDKIADLILSDTVGEGGTVYVDVHGKDLTVK
jgi:ATP-dependent Clp protease ATP-binding subunit ClpB